MFGNASAMVDCANVDNLNIHLGNGNNIFLIHSTSPITTTDLTTGAATTRSRSSRPPRRRSCRPMPATTTSASAPTTDFSPPQNVWTGSTLTGIQGGLTIDGGSSLTGVAADCSTESTCDRLELFDSSTVGSTSGELTSTEVSGLGTDGIWYGGFQLVKLRLSDSPANGPPQDNPVSRTTSTSSRRPPAQRSTCTAATRHPS